MRDNVTPLLPTEAWKGAVAFAGEQCQDGKRDARKKTFVRCGHSLRGGYRLFLGEDGLVRCQQHRDKHEAARRAENRRADAVPNPDQLDLFEGLLNEDRPAPRPSGGREGLR